MKMNFLPLKDCNKKRATHSKSDKKEIMICFDTEERIEELFETLLHRYPEGLKHSVKGSEFVFDFDSLI